MSSSRKPRPGQNGETSGDTMISLGNTVDIFAHRLNRKLKEQEVRDDASQKEAEMRHSLMLQAMTTIRKALQETCKIKLGGRFRFQMDVDDWEGWPRVELNLIDSVAPGRRDYGLVVTANDRNDLGTILMCTRAGDVLGKAHLRESSEFTKLPLIVKKTVREFLDIIAEYVLDPKKPEELIETQTKALQSQQFDDVDHQLKSTNVFSEDFSAQNNNVVSKLADTTPLEMAPHREEIQLPKDNVISRDEQEREDAMRSQPIPLSIDDRGR